MASSTRSAGASWPISMQQPHDVGVRAAVQRPLQRADRARRSPSRCRSASRRRRGRRTSTRSARGRRAAPARCRTRASPARSAGCRSACRGSSPRGRARDPAGSARRRPAAGRRSRRGSRSARSAGPPSGSSPAASCPRLAIVVAERRRQRPQRVHAVGRRQLLHQPQDRLRTAAGAAASCDCRSPSSARFGSRPCHSR